MTTRSKRSLGGAALLLLAVLFLALSVLNNAALRGVRLDLTENRLFTLSEGTRDLLAGIEEPINLYFFYSRDAAQGVQWLQPYARRVREMLQEFAAESDGRIRLTEIEPEPFTEAEDRAAAFGLQAVSLGAGSDPLYFGLAGTNALDDTEVIPFFQPDREALLEYDLAKLVYSLATPERTVVGLLSTLPMTGGFDPASGRASQPWVVTTQLRQLFDVRNLATDIAWVDDDVDLLVLVHPKDLSDATLYAIDQFVMGGGKLIVFLDPVSDAELPRDIGGASAALFQDRSSALEPLLGAWGIAADTEQVVLDETNALSVNTTPGEPPVRHLAFLGIGPDGLADGDPVTAELDRVNLATAGHVETKTDAGIEQVPLLTSSDNAALAPKDQLQFLPDPTALRDEFAPTGERYVLAARFRGALSSAYPDGPPETARPPEGTAHRTATDGPANLIVVADTDLLTDRLWVQAQSFFGQRVFQAFAGNGALVVNAVDNMTGSSELIAVRSRGSFSRPFEHVEALRREADAEFLAQEQALERQLNETEQRLADLQSSKGEDQLTIITPEQQAELERFQAEKLRIRKALRDVRRNLDRSIEDLGTTLKLINIGLVPLLIGVVALLVAFYRSRRRAGGRA